MIGDWQCKLIFAKVFCQSFVAVFYQTLLATVKVLSVQYAAAQEYITMYVNSPLQECRSLSNKYPALHEHS